MIQDVFASYEHGLQELFKRLIREHPRYSEALIYQHRLIENIQASRRYGDTDNRYAERFEIIDRLNELAFDALKIYFSHLCGLDSPAPPQMPLAPVTQITWLVFQHNPFDFREAERMTPKMLDETFVDHFDFNTHVLSPTQSTVLIAATGGGKTAGRMQFERSLERERERVISSDSTIQGVPLAIIYNNFQPIARRLPTVALEDHIEPLMIALARSVCTFICSYAEQFVRVAGHLRRWWWSFLIVYCKGLPLPEQIAGNESLITDYQLHLPDVVIPFAEGSSFRDILSACQTRLAQLGFTKLFILVDEADSYLETQSPSNLGAILEPLLNALPLLSSEFTWKFFLPRELKDVVKRSVGFRTGRLNVIAMTWDPANIKNFLQRRLEWGSNATVQDIAQLCHEELLAKVDIENELIAMALRHRMLGPPRALLSLGNQLFQNIEEEQLSYGDWTKFTMQVQEAIYPLNQLRVVLDMAHQQFTPAEQKRLVATLAGLIDMSFEQIGIVATAASRTEVILELPENAAIVLASLYITGDVRLQTLHIIKVEVLTEPTNN